MIMIIFRSYYSRHPRQQMLRQGLPFASCTNTNSFFLSSEGAPLLSLKVKSQAKGHHYVKKTVVGEIQMNKSFNVEHKAFNVEHKASR